MLPNTHQSPAPRDAMLGVTGCWIVDFFPLFHRGPVVPQEPYLPSGTYDQIKTKYEGLRGPIWFVNKNGTVGIPMINALSGITDTLWGTENVVPNTKKSTHFTLKVRRRFLLRLQLPPTDHHTSGVDTPSSPSRSTCTIVGESRVRSTGNLLGKWRLL